MQNSTSIALQTSALPFPHHSIAQYSISTDCTAQKTVELQHSSLVNTMSSAGHHLGCFCRAGHMFIDETENEVSALRVQLSHEGHLEAIQQGPLHAVQGQGSTAVLQCPAKSPQAVAGLLMCPILQPP